MRPKSFQMKSARSLKSGSRQPITRTLFRRLLKVARKMRRRSTPLARGVFGREHKRKTVGLLMTSAGLIRRLKLPSNSQTFRPIKVCSE